MRQWGHIPVIRNLTTFTVGATGNFTTIQGACNFLSRAVLDYQVTVNIDPGTYAEDVALRVAQGASTLKFVGDTRALAGCSWVSGNGGSTVPIQSTYVGGGSGNCTLSSSGNDIVVTGSTTNPDFAADGWVAGNQIYVLDNTSTWVLKTIASVVTNTITLTAAAPAVGNLGTTLVLLPNVRISSAGSNAQYLTLAPMAAFGSADFKGIWFDRTLNTGSAFQGGPAASSVLTNCALSGGLNGLYTTKQFAGTLSNSTIFQGPNGHVNGNGLESRAGSTITASNVNVIGYYTGVRSVNGSQDLDVIGTISAKNTNGFYCAISGVMRANSAVAVASSGTGFTATSHSYILATSAQAVGCGADWSPASASTEGNVFSIIER